MDRISIILFLHWFLVPIVHSLTWISPPYNYLFDFPLPIPGVAQPKYTKTINGIPVQYYEFNIKPFPKQIYPNLGKANLVGYNGSSPGPTYMIPKGTESVHRYINNGVLSSSVHLHGGLTRAPWDGWADDQIQPGQFKDYYYSNSLSARTLWYHDHADKHTAVDAYYGQNGVYIIYDPNENLGLPSGKYDIPLVLIDKTYLLTGDLLSPAAETQNFVGDIIHVNGQPWPYFNVEPRKYRFRLVNTALSRPFSLNLTSDASPTVWPFQVIASDAGLFTAPVTTNSLTISMGERYEIVIDFSTMRNSNVTMWNSMNATGVPNYVNTDRVMRFVVGGTVSSTVNNSVPATLASVPFPPQRTNIDHVFNFQKSGAQWTINGATYSDVNARVLARPPEGTVERWQLRYVAGPGVHPVHIHLISFQVNSRVGGRPLLPYEAAGLKDVVLLAPGEVVEVTAMYGPYAGLYQFHCHNLIHEDHEMMDVMNVTALTALGYTDVQAFNDPRDPRYQAKFYQSYYSTSNYILNTLLPSLVNSAAYSKEKQVVQALSAYYQNNPYGEATTVAGTSSVAKPTTLSTTTLTSATTATATSTLTSTKSTAGGGLLGAVSSVLRTVESLVPRDELGVPSAI